MTVPEQHVLPVEFWDRAPRYKKIKEAAHSSSIEPTGLLALLLARVSAMIPHQIKTPELYGVPAGSLNLCVALIGAPGAGKTVAMKTASSLLPAFTSDRNQFRDMAKPVSGEALSAAFQYLVKTGRGEQDQKNRRYNVFVWFDEGTQIFQQTKRSGATLNQMVCSAWAGASLSGDKTDDEESRYIQSDTYSLGFAMGLQPDAAQPLFDTEDIGLIQRFLFMPISFREDYDPEGWRREKLPIEPFNWRPPTPINCQKETGLNISPMITDDVVRARLWELRKNPEFEMDDIMDVHHVYNISKLASLIALFDSRQIISRSDLEEAELMMAVSRGYRTDLQQRLELLRELEARDRKELNYKMDDQVKEEHEAAKFNKQIDRVLQLLESRGEWVTAADIDRLWNYDGRKKWKDPILEELAIRGLVDKKDNVYKLRSNERN